MNSMSHSRSDPAKVTRCVFGIGTLESGSQGSQAESTKNTTGQTKNHG